MKCHLLPLLLLLLCHLWPPWHIFSPNPEQPGHRNTVKRGQVCCDFPRFAAASAPCAAHRHHARCDPQRSLCVAGACPVPRAVDVQAVCLLLTSPGTGSQPGPWAKGEESGEMKSRLTGGESWPVQGRDAQSKKKRWSHVPEIQMSLPLDAEKQSLVMSFFFF